MIRSVRVSMDIGKGLVLARMIVLVSEVVCSIDFGGFAGFQTDSGGGLNTLSNVMLEGR